jgi:hypothetical protein
MLPRRAKLLQVYKVFASPRCQNVTLPTPAARRRQSRPLAKRKARSDGHGVYGMRCDTCHQLANRPRQYRKSEVVASRTGAQNGVRWRTPGQLCRQLKDPKQTGGRSLAQSLEHVSSDDLVGWGWDPGTGRALPPLSRADTVAQMKIWIDGGAACPQ